MATDTYFFFLESLNQIDQSLRQSDDLDQMMKDLLDMILTIFKSDRAWLLYPCDPKAPSWGVPMERTQAGYPGALTGGKDIPMLPEAISVFNAALESNIPVAYDTTSNHKLPPEAAQQFSIQSQLTTAIYPKTGKPWLLGMHQCSHPRIWLDDEKKLFLEIGRRTADALNTLLLLEELRGNEAKYRAVVNNSPDLIYRTDMTGAITFVSPSVFNLSGYTVEEALGMKMAQEVYANPDDRNLFLKQIMEKGKIENFEAKLKHKDGSIWWASTNAHVLKDTEGNVVGVEGTTRNISEKKMAEEKQKKLEDELRQSHKMEAIGTISGGIAHDFNNILGIILGNAELALETTGDWNPARFNIEEIKKAGIRASDVVRQLLNFSRKAELVKKTINIGSVINETMTLLRSSIPTSIDIKLNLPPLSKRIKADPTQIHQVLINLCTNASHAMEKNGGILSIDLSEVQIDTTTDTLFQQIDPGHYIQLAIRDSGPGIDPEIKDKIFDPYFTTKEVGKGTGMGLAVVLGIVKNHNGAITFDSEKGNGTCFTVFFPAIDEDPVDENVLSTELPKGNEKVLLIDDEEALVKVGRLLLEQLGYKVETKTDPQEALNLIRSDPASFDLVITDMTMPYLNGDQLIIDILKINPDIPIILYTGFSNKINQDKAIRIGARGYLEKPLSLESLAVSIRKALDGKVHKD